MENNIHDQIERLLIDLEIKIEISESFIFEKTRLLNLFSEACKLKGKENKKRFNENFTKFNNLMNYAKGW